MNGNKINFTKRAIAALPLPEKGKRSIWHDTKTRGLILTITGAGTKSFLLIAGLMADQNEFY
jgi:hypothetical protein